MQENQFQGGRVNRGNSAEIMRKVSFQNNKIHFKVRKLHLKLQ